jgi:hypothetical protein
VSDVKRKIDQFVEEAILGRVRYYGIYRYRARFIGDPPAKPDLVPVNAELGLRTLKACEMSHGTPGMTSRINNRTTVWIVFEGGDPNAPFVHSFGDEEASEITIQVENEVTIKGKGSASTSPVMLFNPFSSWLSSLNTYVTSVQAWMVAATPLIEPSPGPLVGAMGVVTSARGLLATAASNVVQNYPIGAKATKIKGA